ncbi:MAG: hypothetical protein K0S76_1160 [Herbinix sp.]|jgi:regulator of cell morphogenesis and NO signaling|nr:hypothetical protein [Herbinix sp.]
MNNINKEMTIGGIVAALPEAKNIFSAFDIDFCCGGNRLLSEVIIHQNLKEEDLQDRLNAALKERKNCYEDREDDFTQMSPSVLSTYIEDKHHSYMRQTLPQISQVLETILRVHGINHRELFDVYRLFGTLKADLEQHLLKEETMLFPALSRDEINRGEVTGLTTEIIGEHVAAGDILSKLRNTTKNYTLPEDACGTYQMAYYLLEEMEKDLHQHIHLENNILLKEYDLR